MNNKIIFAATFLILLLLQINMYAQKENPCRFSEEGPTSHPVVSFNKPTSQSSVFDSPSSHFAADGNTSENFTITNISRNALEENPWWEVDLEDLYVVEEVELYYPEGLYPDGLRDYYILFSPYPFQTEILSEALASPLVDYVHVSTELSSGTTLSVDAKQGQYVRLQMAGTGTFPLSEFVITGGSSDEICDNGIDDDCDGKIDCQDFDCSVQISNIEETDPTCPYCADGAISIEAFTINGALTFSVDGNGFEPCEGNKCRLEGLLEGTYTIVVTNGICSEERVVDIMAPRGTHNGCFNGSFEDGTYDGWTGGVAPRVATIPIFLNSTLTSANHQIIPTVGNDPNFGSLIPLDDPSLGEYVGRLVARRGEDNPISTTESEISRYTYCFTVDESNFDFHFKYALVLESPNHLDHQQPFFEWKIINANTQSLIDGSGSITADPENPFFINRTPSNATSDLNWLDDSVIRAWTCQASDLSAHIGEEVCVEFVVGGCTEAGHGAYAYIDGLCTPTEEAAPQFEIDLKEVYCQNQVREVNAFIQNNFNFDRFTWKVCRDSGDPVMECFTSVQIINNGVNLKFIDILGWFFTPPNDPVNGPLQCEDKFILTLSASNECGLTREVEEEFTYVCEDLFVDYPDIFTCLTDVDILVEGTSGDANGNCNNCNYEWSPAQFLNDPTLSHPTILNDFYGGADDHIYTVEVTNDAGCKETDELEIFNIAFGELPFTAVAELESVEYLNACSFIPSFKITFSESVDPTTLTVDVKATSDYPGANSGLYEAVLIGGATSGTEHVFELLEDLDRKGTWTFEVRVYNSFGGLLPEDPVIIGSCSIDIGLFSAPSIFSFYDNSVYIPNVFSPNIDGNNDTFGPEFGDDSGIFAARVMVFNHWGAQVFDSGLPFITAPFDGPGLTGFEPELRWDGTFNGQNVNSDVYTYIVSYSGCFVSLNCDPDECQYIDSDCPTCIPYYPTLGIGNFGDVTVIH